VPRKKPGKSFKNGAACASFRDHLASITSADQGPRSWAEVESGFLRAMERFDAEVIAGRASEGERQNGKGDYFNEVIAAIVENASGVPLNRRTGVKGLVFRDYNLDVTHPSSGQAEILIEAKTMGTPKHPGNEQADPAGRSASADLPKRLREAGFKTIDLKAGYGFHQTGADRQAGPSGSLTSWLRKAKPLSYVLIAARVTDEGDLKRMIDDTVSMTKIMDGMGLFCFMADDPTSPSPVYSSCEVPASVELARTLHDVAQQMG
jgi:hypothetical protein